MSKGGARNKQPEGTTGEEQTTGKIRATGEEQTTSEISTTGKIKRTARSERLHRGQLLVRDMLGGHDQGGEGCVGVQLPGTWEDDEAEDEGSCGDHDFEQPDVRGEEVATAAPVRVREDLSWHVQAHQEVLGATEGGPIGV